MMHKKTKHILTVAVAALFVLSVGYFAVLPPTSAYFYQKKEDTKTFVFGTLNVDQTYTSTDIVLPAATKLEDPTETHFNDVADVFSISAENKGTFPARVYATVNNNEDLSNGLHYFFYEEADKSDINTPVKDVIKNMKFKMNGVDNSIISNDDNAGTYSALKDYNVGTGGKDAGRYVIVKPGETKILHIAFWVDYNAIQAGLDNTDNVTEYVQDDIPIKLSAVQNTDGAFTR